MNRLHQALTLMAHHNVAVREGLVLAAFHLYVETSCDVIAAALDITTTDARAAVRRLTLKGLLKPGPVKPRPKHRTQVYQPFCHTWRLTDIVRRDLDLFESSGKAPVKKRSAMPRAGGKPSL